METINNKIQLDYSYRINKALTYIDHHFDQNLSLEIVAAVACYSPFHFHRIFKEVIGEPLNAYITRKRIEKTASVLMRKKEMTITELSLKYGFNSNSSFTRAFKKFYGISPAEFRKNCPDQFSKISKTDSKNGKAVVIFEKYICNIDHHQNWIKMNANIEIREIPALNLAYIPHVGHANLDQTFERLMKWAAPKGLLNSPEFKPLTIYHDSFKISVPEKVRMSACVILSEPVKVDGEICSATIDKGKYVVGHYEISAADFGKTWSDLFVWLNKNGYKTTEKNCFEIYQNDYREHPEKKFIVDLYIPV